MEAVPTADPPSVFIDSSVLFSAAYSGTGSARDLLHAAVLGRVILALSEYVLDETDRNILANAPHAYGTFQRLQAALPYRLITPSNELVHEAARIVVIKDAPIVAGAHTARADFLATYDRKDLLSRKQEIHEAFGLTVATPQEILASL